MPGEGGMLHAIKTIANNRALKRSQRQKSWKKTVDNYKFKKTKYSFDSIKLTDEELKKVKTEIKLKIQKQKRKEAFLAIILTIIFFIALYFILT